MRLVLLTLMAALAAAPCVAAPKAVAHKAPSQKATPKAAAKPVAPPSLEKFRDASKTLSAAMIAAGEKNAPLPMLTDPGQDAVFRDAFDERVLNIVDWTNMQTGMPNCIPALQAVQLYAMYGAPTDPGSMSAEAYEAANARAATDNAVRYHDEQAVAMSFAISCFAHAYSPFPAFWAGLAPTDKAQRQDGMITLRSGTAEIYDGAVQLLAQAPYTLANKTLVLDALTRNSAFYAGLMTPALRAKVIAAIDTTAPKAPVSLKAKLAGLRATFARTDCAGLCAA